jgi:hypothetical protein
MEGPALIWFRALRDRDGLSTWSDFLQVVQSRFSILEKIEDLGQINEDSEHFFFLDE